MYHSIKKIKVMKIYSKLMMMLTAALAFTACSSDDDFSAGEQEKSGVQSAYFNTASYVNKVEVEPGNDQFEVTVSRWNTAAAATVGLVVVSDESNVFDVPSSVNFDAGQADAVVTISAPRAEGGVAYNLVIGIAEADRSIYGKGFREVAIEFSMLKWENLGTGYFIDGTVSSFFGVDPTLPFAVEVQKCTTANGDRFRFESPFAHVATGVDEAGLGYIGYPYNEEGDCDEQAHMIVIDITAKGALWNDTELGMNWGYGMFKVSALQYGTYDEGKGYIAFPAGSLGIEMSDYNPGEPVASANDTFLFLSADAFINYMESAEEE
jgi:hypothetical protein